MPHLLLQQIHPQFYFSPLKFSSSLQSSPFPSQFQASRPCFYSPSSVNLLPPPPVMRGATIRCMANSRRVKMVAKQIQRELSDMLLTDKVLQFAILPEASLGADKYLSSLTTITDVEVSADLQVVKVYVSVFGDEKGKDVAMAGLKSKAKYVRSVLGKRMKLRLTPEICFIEDESFERGSRVIAILDRIKDKKKDTIDEDFDEPELSDALDDDRDWKGDDADEDIIYVQ
ncbi:putative ribosome-binding factor A [Cucumis melo var. makuwa]|uniref:Ribosome-binding factor A n=1 Tax=Cucumis melo var. makuwa TaxID=1194695 RepID=A0A5A7TVW4_CUCMM|nr:putative ribosome-binding factor A [Cucumis melo var. makuwa]TYK02601.1 putative ribosome-binding factor A [Cucumis melo var. makuwa]